MTSYTQNLALNLIAEIRSELIDAGEDIPEFHALLDSIETQLTPIEARIADARDEICAE